LNKEIYKQGDTVKLQMNCYDNYNRLVSNLNYKYKIISGNNTSKSKATTKNTLVYTLDSTIKSVQKIEINSIINGFTIDTVFEINTNANMDISFFPEGGKCINGLNSQIAFKATYRNGLPADIIGKVVDEKGSVILNTNTLHNGMGVFN
jgi:hypothetical protein